MKLSIIFLFFIFLFHQAFLIDAFSAEKLSDLYSISPLITKELHSSPVVDAGKTKCLSKLPDSTRKLLFDFYYSSALKDPNLANEALSKFSKVCGMIYKESSGNPVACTDMKYNGSHKAVVEFCKNDSLASVSMFNKLRSDETVTRNYQTNFGLLQLSADILTWNPNLRSIFENVVKEVSANPAKAMVMCGSACVFSSCEADLLKKMDSFKNCKLDYKKKFDAKKKETRPDISADEINCFDHWVSFCPNLNIALGMKLPSSYFESRGAPSLCEDELSLILSSVMLKKRNVMTENAKCSVNEK